MQIIISLSVNAKISPNPTVVSTVKAQYMPVKYNSDFDAFNNPSLDTQVSGEYPSNLAE